jgi:DNA mismatch repair protein MutS
MIDMDSEELITELNFKHIIVDERLQGKEFNVRKMFDLLPATIADKRTLRVVEIHNLFKAINYTRTMVGSARLFHSLMNPSQSIELVHAKQDSYCELENNHKLQEAISDFLEVFAKGEADLFKILNVHTHPLIAYGDYKEAVRSIERMLAAAARLPQPETVYLDSLFKSIASFSGSPTRSILVGPAFRTWGGIKAREEIGRFTPALRFQPHRLGFGSLWPAFPGIAFGAAWFFGLMDPMVAKALCLGTSWFSVVGFIYGGVLKPMIDYETAILPIRQRLIESNRFASAIESAAAIDELLSFVKFSHAMPHPTVLPEVTNEETHFFVAKNLRNPIIAKDDKDFVANDVNLTGARMTFVTGPNSGGKTTYCKSIVQNQILAQIGAPVVASGAMINMADRITYQAPAFDTLSDAEGRFGTELKVTRDIFYSATPQSLTILDEIAEGTTTHEKISLSVDIMNGFYAIGNNTLLVTHSFELVETFKRQGMGQYLQVEFMGDESTHKIMPGISTDSHALRVAQKIGFAPDDIRSHLCRKGYIQEGDREA